MNHLKRLCFFVRAVICLTLTSQPLWAQAQTSRRAPGTVLEILGSNRTEDGLRGPVSSVRTETAKLSVRAGKLVEGPRALVEVTRYDAAGNRIENETYALPPAAQGQETYIYDREGHAVERSVRDRQGALLSRTIYTYEFDAFGNWTKRIESNAVSVAGEEALEPAAVTYRAITYYADALTGGTMPAAAGDAGESAIKSTNDQACPDVHQDGGAGASGLLADVGMLNDKTLSLPPPALPVSGRRLAQPILVSVAVIVDETGRVTSAEAADGPPELRRAAEGAARRAGFLPFKARGRPVKVRGVLCYSFPYQP